MTDVKITPELLKERFGLSLTSEFVPFTKSRSYDPKVHEFKSVDGRTCVDWSKSSLNWKVKLLKDDREVIATDYTAGVGHAPSYKNYNPKRHGVKFSMLHTESIKHEVERGREADAFSIEWSTPKGKPILPVIADVVYSLLTDSEAIDYVCFEDWADSFGYDRDSRSAEGMYRQSLEIGLRLRAHLGDSKLAELRELFADY